MSETDPLSQAQSQSVGSSSNLRKRVITAVIGVSLLLLLVVFGGREGVSLIAAVLALGMAYEFLDMVLALPDKPEKKFATLGTIWLVAFVNYWLPRSEYEILVLVFLSYFSYFLFTADRHPEESLITHFKELMACFFGILYLGFLPLYLPLMRDFQGIASETARAGAHWVILFFLIIWSTDTGAYFAGLKFGKRKLYAAISPKKTVEGLLGGMGLALVVTILYKLILFRRMPWLGAVIIPLTVSAISQVGDLCESFLKRAFGLKDSGKILPGHGGFLDRFDGMVFSLPVMYAAMRIFGQ